MSARAKNELRDRQFDVVIIGGGVVGCSLARELSKYKLSVVVVEMFAEIGFGTSKANSGIVHPGHHDKPGSVKGGLVVRGNQLIKELASELGFGYRQCGEVMVAKNEEEYMELLKLQEQAKLQCVPVEMWNQEKLRTEEPNLSKQLIGALYAPTCGVVSPYEMVHALMGVAMNNGVELLANSPVTSIKVDPEADEKGRLVVCTDTDRIKASYVVNAAGVFADRVANMAGIRTFTIHPRKGEEYLLDKQLQLTHRVIFPVPSKISKGILIIPTVDHTLMCGPTATDTEDRWDLSTTSEGCTTVFTSVKQMCPALNERYVIASFAGLRAASNTGDFIIGATVVPGFINAAGIQSPGLTSAPAIAERITSILFAAGLELNPKDDWKSKLIAHPRFFSMDPGEQETSAKSNPLYGRVVCRCELVTEGDIHSAIDSGAVCLDGVKFRTRAGMGRCQGGFCTSRIVQILSQRLNVRLDEVTKRGNNTQILHREIEGQLEIQNPNIQLNSATTASSASMALTISGRMIDVAIIGGGPAGLAAGLGAVQNGARDVVVFDREDSAGGILNQCIHAGFGIHYFKEELTGPEYAQRFLTKALEQHVKICPSSFVIDVDEIAGGNKRLRVLVSGLGVKTVICRSLVLAMGCRERSRAAIRIPGTRPAGIFTAGLAQRFVNLHGHLPGKRIVVLGSGDIGLIMARRMTLEHCEVVGVFEIMSTCSGLNRNVVQCLHDYKIPLYLAHTVVKIHGKDHLEKVTVAPVDSKMQPIMEKAWDINCDCLLLSVGLIPENEITNQLKIKLSGKTSGPTVSSSLMTSLPGVFACGNVLHVHDLVDNVSKEGLLAGRNAARWALAKDTVLLQPGNNVSYVLPESLCGSSDQVISLRVKSKIMPAVVRIGSLITKHLPVAAPSEMIRITVKKEKIIRFIESQLQNNQQQQQFVGTSSGTEGNATLSVDVLEEQQQQQEEQIPSPERLQTETNQPTNQNEQQQQQVKEGQVLSSHICLSCPHGCYCKVISENKKVLSIVGASCSRGWNYCEQEIRDPRRFFSTSVPIIGAITAKLPVKITKPLPKELLVNAAAEIQKITVHAPIKLGDVLLHDLMGEKGCDVVSCRTLELAEEEYKKYASDVEFATKQVSAPEILIIHDSHDGHSESAANVVSEDLQTRGFENTIGSPEELGINIINLSSLKIAIFFAITIPENNSSSNGIPQSYRNLEEELLKEETEKQKPLSKLHFAVFSVSSTSKSSAAIELGKLLKRAGAIEVFNSGTSSSNELSTGSYLKDVENWISSGLCDSILPFTQPKKTVNQTTTIGSPRKQKPTNKTTKVNQVDWESEADLATKEQQKEIQHRLDIEELPNCYCKSNSVNHYSIASTPDKWLNCIISHDDLCDGVVALRVVCPTIAQFAEPGQFVMVCADIKSERIPLTIADFSRDEGWIVLVIQNVGLSSAKLCALQPGMRIRDISGPLGRKSEISNYHGTIICVGGGVGVAPIYPIMKALKQAGNRIIGVIGAKNKKYVVWEEKFRQYCDELHITTDDGTYGQKGFASLAVENIFKKGKDNASSNIVRVVAIGPGPMMKACVDVVPKEIPVVVSLNTTMVDGTGMCGGCRVTVGGTTAFVCVDGPEFDGRTVDWTLLSSRLAAYHPQEHLSLEISQKGNNCVTNALPWVVPRHEIPNRVPMPTQDPHYRSTNFDEVALGLTPQMAIAEASRCKGCENATCRDGCPVGVDIKGFIKLIQQHKFRAAAKLIKKYNPCPAICGRVCPQETQCEATCYLKSVEKRESVAIGNLERFVADFEASHPSTSEDNEEEADEQTIPNEEGDDGDDDENEEEGSKEAEVSISDKRVAIIGAGPAGLICAAEIASHGAKVTVFEALNTSGGVLSYGIPAFRLPKTIVERETSYIRDRLGVEFRFNWPVGPAGSVPQLLNEGFSAVFIGTGAGLPWFLGIEGENLKGVYSSNEFLTRVNLMKAYKFPEYPTPVLLGESVAVIGGGNVAMDAARSAKRLGAKNVYICYRRTRKELPARLEEIHHALEEGIILRELVAPTKIRGDDKGCVCGMDVQIMELGAPDASGRCKPIPTQKFELIEVQQVVVAVGNGPNPMLTKAWPELKINDKGHISVDKSQATNVKGVYAGGDIATGAATVIEAMGAGKRAAASIVHYLRSL